MTETNKCIALDEHEISAIPSTKHDIIETILNAKYQIKYCDIFDQTRSGNEQYGKEYQCKTLEQFAIPVDIDDHNQFMLMIAPFVQKTASAHVQGAIDQRNSFNQSQSFG
eukprot:520189_1